MSVRDEIWFWRGVTVTAAGTSIVISILAIVLSLGAIR